MNNPGKFPPDQAGTIGFTHSTDSSAASVSQIAKIYKLNGKSHIFILLRKKMS